MKKIKYIAFIALFSLLFTQCDQEYDDNTAGFSEGGLITTSTAVSNYVVGDGASYGFDMFVKQNPDFNVTEVRLYKSADIAVTKGMTAFTNEILVETIPVEGTIPVTIYSNEYDYAALIEGLTLNGNPLPSSDGELTIGDKFIFRVEAVLDNGNVFQQAWKANMTVSTRFAGTYICTALQYFRLGVLSPSYWLGNEIVIESVDAITYFYDWGITIGWDGPLYFQVDGDGNITYPEEWNGVAQVLNGNPLTVCDRNPLDLTNVPCEGSDIVIKDDVNGADQLIMTYGYFTAGSGPREFHETLVKKVN